MTWHCLRGRLGVYGFIIATMQITKGEDGSMIMTADEQWLNYSGMQNVRSNLQCLIRYKSRLMKGPAFVRTPLCCPADDTSLPKKNELSASTAKHWVTYSPVSGNPIKTYIGKRSVQSTPDPAKPPTTLVRLQ